MKHPIAYEPHPVSPERKAELRAQGFIIVDARFKPADYEEPKAEPLTRTAVARMKKTDLADQLKARGLEWPKGGSVDDARLVLAEAEFGK